MGLGLKTPVVTVKAETNNDSFKDSAGNYAKGSSARWPFPNKVSALPHFMSFKTRQEDKTRKNISEPHISSAFGSLDTFDQARAILEFQNQQAVSTVKHQLLGGIPITSPNTILPAMCSVAGITEPRNNTKPSGSPAQLTIFYAGTVNVYDSISPEKMQAIMFLAGNSSPVTCNAATLKAQVLTPTAAIDGIPMNTASGAHVSPPSVSSHTGTHSASGSTSTDDLMAAKTAGTPSTPVTNTEIMTTPPPTSMMPSAVPQARKASLARFLEKRKERMMNAAPYNLCKSSSECTAVESNGANFSANHAV